jgi:hypothetical protein
MTKIAMWSGPRNLSTAMMYAFGARADCAVWDEPFYAPYLAETGLDHPMRSDILAAHESDAKIVARRCAGRPPDGKEHWYMKHMPHHMLDGFDMTWAEGCVNMHLIRHPARVIASYLAKRDMPSLLDIGYPQQWALYQRLPGPIFDSTDIRANPEAMLRMICAAADLPFDAAMLSWPAGPRAQDGIWAKHWYGAVHRSTGISDPEGPLPDLPKEYHGLLTEALEYYEQMRSLKHTG